MRRYHDRRVNFVYKCAITSASETNADRSSSPGPFVHFSLDTCSPTEPQRGQGRGSNRCRRYVQTTRCFQRATRGASKRDEGCEQTRLLKPAMLCGPPRAPSSDTTHLFPRRMVGRALPSVCELSSFTALRTKQLCGPLVAHWLYGCAPENVILESDCKHSHMVAHIFNSSTFKTPTGAWIACNYRSHDLKFLAPITYLSRLSALPGPASASDVNFEGLLATVAV